MTPRLDLDLCWREALRLLSATREIAIAIAGVFVFLPSLALALLVKQPELAGDADFETLVKVFRTFYQENWLSLLLVSLAGAIGGLSLYVLMLVRGNPSVGEALGAAVKLLIPYMIANLLAGLLTMAGAIAFIIPGIYVFLRLLPLAPVVAAEGISNPLTALSRTWALTKGNVARIGLFLLIVGITAYIVMFAVNAVLGAVLTLAVGAGGAVVPVAIVSTLTATALSVLFIAVYAAIYRQLQGGGEADPASRI